LCFMPTLIYDNDCPYCKAVSLAAAVVSNIQALPYESEKAQEMLESAFEDPGFTLYLFEEESVYWGREAARRTLERTSLPKNLFLPFIRFYPQFVRTFSVLSGRNGVREPVCTSERCLSNEKGGGRKKLAN